MVGFVLSGKDKLDADFQKFKLRIEQTAQEEIRKIRFYLDAIKNQAENVDRAVLSSSSNEEKRS